MNGCISDSLEILTDMLDETIKKFDADIIEIGSIHIDNIQEEIQKTINEKLQEPIGRLVKKLKEDENLTIEDIKLIEKWVIGDAEFYTRMENNLIDWIAECKRLFNVLSHYTYKGIEEDENKLLALGAILTDLKFTLNDVIRYSEALNRVDKFRTLTRGGAPNAETKRLIAEIIEKKAIFD